MTRTELIQPELEGLECAGINTLDGIVSVCGGYDESNLFTVRIEHPGPNLNLSSAQARNLATHLIRAASEFDARERMEATQNGKA